MSRKGIGLTLIVFSIIFPLAVMYSVQHFREQKEQGREVLDSWTLPTPFSAQISDPQQALQVQDKTLLSSIFNRLVRINEFMQVEADLAKSWTYSVPNKTYVFTLREDVKFHDGSPLTASDVAFSIQQWSKSTSLDHDILDSIEGVQAFQRGLSARISGVEIISKNQVSIRLAKWVDNFVVRLTNPRFVIFPQHFGGLSKAEYLAKPVGTGPFRVATMNAEETLLASNPTYFQGKSKLQQIHVKQMTEEEAISALREGKIDNLILYDINNGDGGFDNQDLVISPQATNSTFALILAPVDKRTKRKRDRESIVSGFPRESLVKNCYPLSTVATTLIPPGLIGSMWDSKPTLAKASSVHSSEALASKPLDIYIPDYLRVACLRATLVEPLRRQNARLKVAKFEEMYRLLKSGKLAAWIEDLSFKAEDPLSTLNYFNKKSEEYFLTVNIALLNRLFDMLNITNSSVSRSELYNSINSFLTEEYFAFPLFYYNRYLIRSKRLHGADFLASAKFTQSWNQIYVEKK